jgi:hypothetical protein
VSYSYKHGSLLNRGRKLIVTVLDARGFWRAIQTGATTLNIRTLSITTFGVMMFNIRDYLRFMISVAVVSILRVFLC